MILTSLFLLLNTATNMNMNMNMNGDIYYISNPNTSSSIPFSTVYSNQHSKVEFFDVYSAPITSRYGEVYWTLMDPVNLPSQIVSRFHNKPIAIVGYEMDQVLLDNTSVPITWSYNHHYEAFLYGGSNQLLKIGENKTVDSSDMGSQNHGYHSFVYLNDSLQEGQYPGVQLFSEANGGESRASYHGYPTGYAQVLYSPKLFRIQPMQIDTRNRDPLYINDTVFHPSLLPHNAASPANASYSGLLECPCTTRTQKVIKNNYYTETNASCLNYLDELLECQTEIEKLVLHNTEVTEINSLTEPRGCFFNTSGGYYNNNKNSITCHTNTKPRYRGLINNSNLQLDLLIDNKVLLNITGPKDVWFGIAFNASTMGNLPYSIIVLGDTVEERKLANHDMGTLLQSSIKILRNVIIGDKRSVIISRDINNSYYNFNDQLNIPILWANGQSETFGYHKSRGATMLSLYSLDSNTCICYSKKTGTINGIPFQKRCAAEPIGDLLHQRNPSCFVDTYQGGLSCCAHKTILLDANQTQPEYEMTYRIKFRFWFQEYQNHQQLVRPYFQTEAFSGEYDVPKCEPGTPYEERIHSITGRWQVKDMVDANIRKNTMGLKFIYAGPHCHAPTCISMELYNADTGQLICGVIPEYGKGRLNVSFDELDYIRVDPCVWGEDAGLMEPMFLSWDTNLTSIKKNNNTNAHYGEMASWQTRAVLV